MNSSSCLQHSLLWTTCGARFSNQGHLLCFYNLNSKHSDPVHSSNRSNTCIASISYYHETDWSRVFTCCYRWYYDSWNERQLTNYLEQVANWCEQQCRNDLQLLWRIQQRGGWKLRNSTVWELFQRAVISQQEIKNIQENKENCFS
ncbi:hypothetical protein GAYE_SCF16G3620 [Galdieria yellowstonensis]|uniref:Uncharacterized protein n=1 Tax=Galdieria yellowstonensis TaxID=3028027 RepID=A0AAV9IET9_9RHOD|nr:hypothetical protein GAYE_SCF16G3620 [Galdieria yellowstonensis]